MTQAHMDTWPPFPVEQRRPVLLILAGPSGCGKTTFARALYDGRLPEPIRELLPARIETAPNVDIKYPAKTLPISMRGGRETAPESGCMLHYTLNRLARLGIKRVDDDPTFLKFRDSTDASITIVNVVVSGKTLAGQYVRRMFHPELVDRYAGRNLLVLRTFRIFEVQKIVQAVRYRFGGAERLYRDWDTLVSEMCSDGRKPESLRIRVIGVAPAAPREGEPGNFRLLYCRDHPAATRSAECR